MRQFVENPQDGYQVVSGFFEENFTQRAQFQLLTICAWFSGLILLVVVIKLARHSHGVDVWFVPLLHMLPWLAGVFERRKLLRDGSPDSGTIEITAIQSLIRLLWAAYVALILIELTWLSK